MKAKIIICLAATVMLTGCASIGPKQLRREHYPYNESLVRTWKDELLLNLVRLRYRDDPYFLEVSGITSSHTLGVNAFATFTYPDLSRRGSQSTGAGVQFDDSPTISYLPLQGKEYVKRLLSNISLDMLLKLSYTGWSVERIFNICIQEMNGLQNAPSASGPTPANAPEYLAFNHLMKQFRILQNANILMMDTDPNYNPLAPESLVEPGDKDLYIAFRQSQRYASIVDEILNTLKLSPECIRYKLSGNIIGDPKPNLIRLKTRTLLGVMYFLSHAVQVPYEHIACGLVTETLDEYGRPFDWNKISGEQLKIHSSKCRPICASISVCYRGHWFYIDDTDLNSKTTFLLLSKLADIQTTSSAANLPQLTIPLR